jgi:molecular chaperone GrpE
VSEREPTEGRPGTPEPAPRPAPDPAPGDDRAAAVPDEAEAISTAEVEDDYAPSADGAATAGAEAAPPKDPLAQAEEERAEYLALAQRAKADFENYRRRASRDIAAAGARGRSDVLRELLPVIDNLERALEAAGEEEGALSQGVRLVHSELAGILERNGVEPIDPAGEPFDPTVHEALSTRSENGAEAGVVLDVVQRGYRLDQSVLRPARVVVSA